MTDVTSEENPLCMRPPDESPFLQELIELLNTYAMEDGSHTPDYILALYLVDCLKAFDRAVNERKVWHRA